MHPDRIVIGSESKKAIEIMKEAYKDVKAFARIEEERHFL